MAHSYVIETRGDHLWVAQEGLLETLDDAQLLQDEVRRRVESSGVRLAVWDNRRTDRVSEEVRDTMFRFVTSDLCERVALLLESSLAVIRVNMDAVACRAKLRAFDHEPEALDWLRSSRMLRRAALPTG